LGEQDAHYRSTVWNRASNGRIALNWNVARKAKQEAAKAPQDMVKQPDPFKKETKWKQWKESILTY